MIFALLLSLFASVPHPDSLSTSRISIDGSSAQLELRCQVLSLMEVIDDLDRNGDELVSPEEITAREQEILAYVAGHYQLYTGTDRHFDGGRRLEAIPQSASYVADRPEDAAGFRMGAVDLLFRFESDRAITDLAIEMTLFAETSPLHIDYTSVSWREGLVASHVLEAGNSRARIDPEGRGVWSSFLTIGISHILGG